MRLPRTLAPIEIRVLGSLLEKQQATPEYYPLTLGALIAACNQKSNREPVLELSESDVLGALESMRELVLVWKVTGSRADKWEENLTAKLGLTAATKAILTLLFLRDPQTPGELKARSDRLHPFATLRDVETALSELSMGKDPLVAVLPRRPGQKETRWGHILSGEVPSETSAAPGAVLHEALSDRVARLEERLEALAAELNELRTRLGDR
jgi:uncharacterized protein